MPAFLAFNVSETLPLIFLKLLRSELQYLVAVVILDFRYCWSNIDRIISYLSKSLKHPRINVTILAKLLPWLHINLQF